ncbi:unnamed protein product [Parascedosporium putredinis]|uniref:Uncharacterized protein n=1 Tax=Parascedosporium putredinis TaxID=1442378 RepID=A0A9P1GYH6_9PEZI|nr:unnamed protein product [Parascedosporium putredinis]CAI7991772.1 unnamed protein product [Parascedosporium putredinis]
MSLISRLSSLLPLPEEELKQVLDYAATLPKAAAVDHFSNLLGTSPEALTFISDFNSRRNDTAAATTPSAGIEPPTPAEVTKPAASKKSQQGGFLISDEPAAKSKPKSANASRSSTPKPGGNPTKISIVGGTPMKGASTALTDLDAAIRQLEITTNPTLQDDDAAARRLICMKEGLGPCTTCGAPLLSNSETEAILRELKAERGRERMAADRAAHKRADVGRTPAPFTQPRDGGFASGSGAGGTATLSEAETKAREHRDRLLGYQAQNARRTTVRDEVADFDERAMELKKQQKLLREMEWEMKPEYEKRRQVVSIDLVGGKIVKKMAAVERPVTPPAVEEPGYGNSGAGALSESSGNRQAANHGQGGAFSKNPLLGAMIKPVYNLKGKAKGTGTEGDDAAGSRTKWRRVQDDMGDNEGIILDGGAYGHSAPTNAATVAGDAHDIMTPSPPPRHARAPQHRRARPSIQTVSEADLASSQFSGREGPAASYADTETFTDLAASFPSERGPNADGGADHVRHSSGNGKDNGNGGSKRRKAKNAAEKAADKAWGLYERGQLGWKELGIGAGILGAVGAAELVIGRYLSEEQHNRKK